MGSARVMSLEWGRVESTDVGMIAFDTSFTWHIGVAFDFALTAANCTRQTGVDADVRCTYG